MEFISHEELINMIAEDLHLSSPELDVYTESPHNAPVVLENKYISYALKNAAEKCNIITRYYDDGKIVRAYALYSYIGGICIMYNLKMKTFSIVILGEDDGYWFPRDEWYFDKNDFITLYTEACSIFNENFCQK